MKALINHRSARVSGSTKSKRTAYSNRPKAGMLLLVISCMLTLVFAIGCTSETKDLGFITNTSLSTIQTQRDNLQALLNSSKYGTAPGTYPENSKEILTKEIKSLDELIDNLKAGGSISKEALAETVTGVNQAIDQFKDSRLYNLSEQARSYANLLKAKAKQFDVLLKDDTKWGNHKGQYPIDSKQYLESAIAALNSLVENILSGSITNMTQELYDDAMQSADQAMQKVEDTKWQEDNIVWNLFVDGNNGGYIDFGYSPDYVKFGPDGQQAFTIELWVNITEYVTESGQDNSSFLSTMTKKDYYSGWRAQDRKKGLLRTMVAHWEDSGPSNAKEWEPGWKKEDNWTMNRWTHYAFLFRDQGLPGFDTPTDVKCYSMIDGQRQGEIIRVGEPWRTYISDNCIKYQVHMTGFCSLDDDGNRHEAFSGYIKKIRIWKTNRSEDQVRNDYLGLSTDVTADNPDLVAAWDFEKKGNKPTATEFKDLTGRHNASLKGSFKWVESSEVPQN